MLSLAAAVMGAKSVTAFEIDESAIEIAKENLENLEFEDVVKIVHCDLSKLPDVVTMSSSDNGEEEEGSTSPSPPPPPPPKRFETIIMNPPFGTRTKGIDMLFLRKAIFSCSRAVYSMHKTSTRLHVQKTAASCGALGTVIATLKFDIPKMYAFHTESSKDIEVDLWRVVPNADKTAIECALDKTKSELRAKMKEERMRKPLRNAKKRR